MVTSSYAHGYITFMMLESSEISMVKSSFARSTLPPSGDHEHPNVPRVFHRYGSQLIIDKKQINDWSLPPNIKHPLRNHGLVGIFQIIGTIYGVFNIRVMGLLKNKHDPIPNEYIIHIFDSCAAGVVPQARPLSMIISLDHPHCLFFACMSH